MKRSPSEAQRMWADLALMMESLRGDWTALDRALLDSQLGYPTAVMQGNATAGGDVSDPTGRMGLQPNQADRDRVMLYDALARAHGAMVVAFHVRSRWRPATAMVKRCANPSGCPKFNTAAEGRGGVCWHCYRQGIRAPQPVESADESAA